MESIPDTAGSDRYTCVFCKTGSEQSVAHAIMTLFPGLYATSVRQIKHQSTNGVKSLKEHILLPGYVFISVPFDIIGVNLYDCGRLPDVYRLLTDGEGHWELQGTDEAFARWIINNKGMIGLSQAYMAGDKVQLLSGPLKEREGNIVKIDRRGRNGLIEFVFDGRARRVWLAFEFTEMRVVTRKE